MLAKVKISDNIKVVMWYNYKFEMKEIDEVKGVASYIHLFIIRATLAVYCLKTFYIKRTTQLRAYIILNYIILCRWRTSA